MRFFLAFICIFALCGCVVDPTSGEKKFSPIEVIAKVDESIPDETKAMALEELALLLGAIGAGAVGTPICYGAAAYFRNRKKKQSADEKKD